MIIGATANSTPSPLNRFFERIVVINLPARTDRRREMQEQLEIAGLTAELFPAVQPTEQGEWPSLGARGCFLSHYTVLRQALDANLRNVLFLEDDLDFAPLLPTVAPELIDRIAAEPWDFLYLGHIADLPAPANPAELQFIPWSGGLRTTHFYAVNRSVIPRLVAFLEAVISRPDGHPLGGPQHVDGAFSMFRAQNPDVRTLIASPVLGFQRSSRSDITSSWVDRIPGASAALALARRLRRTHKP